MSWMNGVRATPPGSSTSIGVGIASRGISTPSQPSTTSANQNAQSGASTATRSARSRAAA